MSARDRLEDYLKSPYPPEGNVWSAFLAALSTEFDEFSGVLDAVEASKFVGDATGEQLDKLGSIFGLERRTGETDERYRLRLQTELRALLSSGTRDEIASTTALLLGIDEAEFILREPFDVEPARIDLLVPEPALADRGIDVGEFDAFVEDLAAAGVDVVTFALGTFMHVAEGSDPTTEGAERGYADIGAPETGGTYASLLN